MHSTELRILTIANVSANPNSGAAGTVVNTNIALRELGHSVDEVWVEDLPRRRIRHGNLHSLLEQPRAYRKVALERTRRTKYDVVQISQPQAYQATRELKASGFEGIVINRSHGVELRVDQVLPRWHRVAGVAESRLPLLTRALRPFLHRQWTQVARFSDGVIVGSKLDELFLQARLGIDPRRVRAIPHGIAQPLMMAPIAADDPDRWRRVLHVGQFAFIKGSFLLTDIVNEMLLRDERATFTWVCSAEHHSLIRSRIQARFRHRMSLLPWMAAEDLVEIYDMHGLFLFPSYFEGFGKAPMEAMARGACVVCSDEGGMRDSIRNGATGWLCPVGELESFVECLVDMLANPTRARAIGDAARLASVRMTWQNCALLATEFYADIASLTR